MHRREQRTNLFTCELCHEEPDRVWMVPVVPYGTGWKVTRGQGRTRASRVCMVCLEQVAHQNGVLTCVGCGCTEDRACLVDGLPCAWVFAGWCSACEATSQSRDHVHLLAEALDENVDVIREHQHPPGSHVLYPRPMAHAALPAPLVPDPDLGPVGAFWTKDTLAWCLVRLVVIAAALLAFWGFVALWAVLP